MVSHVSLIVVIISVKNNRSCSDGVAKYKLTKDLSQAIRFKYFFSAHQPPQTFMNGDIVFISGKYVVENSEPYFTIAYSSIIDSGNPNREFDISDVPISIPYCIYSVTINREPKKVENFIHFGAETIQYNSITSKPEVKMNMTIIYPHESPRLKYLGHLGSNIKLQSNYFVSGLLKFSKSGKIMIEATDVDYLKTSTINITRTESSQSATEGAPSIIDIIDNDLDSIATQQHNSFKSSTNANDIINANNEDNRFRDTKNYHTTVEDYLSDEVQSDNRDFYEKPNDSADVENSQ
ncbi:2940_t:CDS:2, partial [Dentiscutata erythropus]